MCMYVCVCILLLLLLLLVDGASFPLLVSPSPLAVQTLASRWHKSCYVLPTLVVRLVPHKQRHAKGPPQGCVCVCVCVCVYVCVCVHVRVCVCDVQTTHSTQGRRNVSQCRHQIGPLQPTTIRCHLPAPSPSSPANPSPAPPLPLSAAGVVCLLAIPPAADPGKSISSPCQLYLEET